MTENIFVDLNGNEQTQISFNDKFDTNDTILSSIKYPDHICLCKEHTYILTNIKSINIDDIKYVINNDDLELTSIFI